nr:hypothetical protein [Tanacetum cinerariifolium]
MNMALALMAKAFKLNYSTPTNNNQRISSNPKNRQIGKLGQNARNPAGYNDVIGNQNQIGNGNFVAARAEGNAAGQNGNQIRGICHYARNCTIRPRRRDAAYLQTQLLITQKNRQIAQPGQNAGNLTGYNDVQNIGNQAIQNANQIENDNLVAARAEGNATCQNGNQIRCYNCRGVGHYARNCTIRPRRRDAAYLQTQLLIA